jgi:hypothetical protein
MSGTENQQELTAEQIAELRKNTLHFYKDRIQFLKVQLEFEKLSADIEEEKLRGLMAQLKMAHITSPPEQQEEEESEKPE